MKIAQLRTLMQNSGSGFGSWNIWMGQMTMGTEVADICDAALKRLEEIE